MIIPQEYPGQIPSWQTFAVLLSFQHSLTLVSADDLRKALAEESHKIEDETA